jgi:gluconolactonase
MKKIWIFAIIVFVVSITLLTGQEPTKASIARLDPALDAIVPADARLELLKDGFKDGLEGGVWDRQGGFLLFSNKPERTISKWTPDGKFSTYLNLAEGTKAGDPKATLSSGTTMDKEGRLVYCSPGQRAIIRVERDGKREVVADKYQGKRFSHPNDLAYKSNGTLYFTDNGEPPKGETEELPNSAYFLKNGRIQLITTGQLVHPNGIAVSADGRFLFINDSAKKQVWRFDIQPDDTVINGRVWADMSSDKKPGIPDGMRVDKKGNVYDAGPGGIWILSPEGKHLGTLLLPPPDRGTNLAFGDADGKTLYLMNHLSVYRIRLNVEGVRP